MEQEIFDKFFEPYSKNVDQVDQTSAFWRLSDALILEIIKKEISPFINENTVILDAGGGTARWAIKINDALKISIIVFDRSKDMLAKAHENVRVANKSDSISLVEGDITNMNSIPDASIDHIVSIYSPLSFIYDQEKALSELYRVLKKGGRLLIMSHGHHNALYSKINNYRTEVTQLKNLENARIVKWSDHVPDLVTHSKESIEALLHKTNFSPIKTYGVPIYVQPGPEDFDPNNEKVSAISKYLEDPIVFQSIFDLEMRHNGDPTICNRGMNIFALAEK